MLLPASTTVPPPLFVSVPPPASTAETVPTCTPNEELRSVPSSMVPPDKVRAPVVCVVPPRSRTPPDTPSVPLGAPSVPAPESCSVPADIVVPPEYVLAPERTSVPGPSIPRKPGVAPSLMTPEMVWVVPAGGVKFGSPEIRKLLARVKFEPLINDSVVSGASDTAGTERLVVAGNQGAGTHDGSARVSIRPGEGDQAAADC